MSITTEIATKAIADRISKELLTIINEDQTRYVKGPYTGQNIRLIHEGLPGVLGNKGTLAKYRREQGNISQFSGTGEQNSKNYTVRKHSLI